MGSIGKPLSMVFLERKGKERKAVEKAFNLNTENLEQKNRGTS